MPGSLRSSIGIGAAVEAVHAERPLQSDDPALDAAEQAERQQRGERQPDREHDPRRQHGAEHAPPASAGPPEWPTIDHGEVGRKIVGALVVQVLAADRAGRDRRQVAAEQRGPCRSSGSGRARRARSSARPGGGAASRRCGFQWAWVGGCRSRELSVKPSRTRWTHGKAWRLRWSQARRAPSACAGPSWGSSARLSWPWPAWRRPRRGGRAGPCHARRGAGCGRTTAARSAARRRAARPRPGGPRRGRRGRCISPVERPITAWRASS